MYIVHWVNILRRNVIYLVLNHSTDTLSLEPVYIISGTQEQIDLRYQHEKKLYVY